MFNTTTYSVTQQTNLIVTLLLAFLLTACGGGSGSGSGGGSGGGGAVVTTLAGTAGMSGATDGTGTAALFQFPGYITTDGTNLYVTDTRNHTIRQIVIATGVVTTLAGTAGLTGPADGTGAAARFDNPEGITTDGTNLYVSDTRNHKVRQIVIATGVVTTLAGPVSGGPSGSTDGTGTAARFFQPFGITTDGTNLYVADTNNHTIRQIVISTGVVTTLAGTAGSPGSTDGTGAAALFDGSFGITTDGTNLYVADTFNHLIRQIVISTGVVTTLAGSAGLTGPADGIGAAARFNYPHDVTTDGTNLYVASAASIVRQIVIATGVVTTLAGSWYLHDSTDGTGAAARFEGPYGVIDDGANLYVVDSSNHTIRKLVR